MVDTLKYILCLRYELITFLMLWQNIIVKVICKKKGLAYGSRRIIVLHDGEVAGTRNWELTSSNHKHKAERKLGIEWVLESSKPVPYDVLDIPVMFFLQYIIPVPNSATDGNWGLKCLWWRGHLAQTTTQFNKSVSWEHCKLNAFGG